jgi:hypothetical protein
MSLSQIVVTDYKTFAMAATLADVLPASEVLGFLWTVQLLIFKGKDGRSDGPNTAQEDQVTTLLL